jgi:hypothetical protein
MGIAAAERPEYERILKSELDTGLLVYTPRGCPARRSRNGRSMIDTRNVCIEVPKFDLAVILAFNAALWTVGIAVALAVL